MKSGQSEEEQALSAAPTGSCCGSAPLFLDKRLTFHDNALDVEIAQKDIDCKAEAEAFDASSGAVSRTCYLQTGDCMVVPLDPGRECPTRPARRAMRR